MPITYYPTFKNSSGNVGIGTISPGFRFDIKATTANSTTTFALRNSNDSYNFIINDGGTASAGADFRAPIFYDSANTAFYVDPASTSVLNALTVGGNNVLTTASTLTAGNLSGTIPSGVLGNSTVNIGTTAIALNRGSGSQTLTGVSIDGNAANVTGTVAIANGGTGNTTAQAAINALAGAVTSGQYLRGNGTNVVMSAIQAADVPTLNQNTTGNAATASLATTSDRLTTRDNRTISPSEDDAFRLRYGFTSWANNDSSPYADYLHLRSYSDASGGNDNLVMFRKDAIGMRIWQQTFGSATAYATFKDVAFTDQSFFIGTTSVAINRSSASQTLTGVSIDGNSGTATILQTARNINGTSFNGSAAITTATWGTSRTITIGSTGKSVDGSAAVSWSLAEIGALPLSGGQITGNTTFSADNHLTFGPNSTWGSSIRIGGNGYTATGTEMASVVTTDGNLHLDAAKSNNGIYMNWYGGTGGVYFGNGSSGQIGFISNTGNASFSGVVDATQFRDASNTAYYLDPANTGTSLLVAGNVGIGNTSPSAKLHVLGASYTTASAANNNVRFEGSGGNGLGFGTIDATSTYASWIQSGYVPNFATATYALLLNPLGGNVGIGTTSPSRKLDVNGDANIGTNLVVGSGIYNANYYAGSSTATYFKNSVGADTLTILQGGNVGIGTTSPSQKLHVVGTGFASTDFRAPIFYDSNDTTYYLDPASTSVMLYVRAANFHDSTGSYNVNLGSGNSEGRGLVAGYSGGSYGGIGYNVRHTTTGGSWIAPSTDTSTYLLFSNGIYFYYAAGGAAGRTLSYSTIGSLTSAGIFTVSGDVRAPIFYDSNNTSYYVDPASTSNLNVLNAVSSTTLWVRSGSWAGDLTSNGFTREIGMQMTGGSEFVILSKSGQGYTLVDGSYYAYEGGGFYSSFNSSYGAIVGFSADSTTSVTFNCNVKAPIYYDSNNTSYYVDPASTSNLNAITAAGNVTAAQYYTGGWFRNNGSGNGLYNESTGQHFYSDSANYWNVASSAGAQGIRLRTGGHNGTVRGYFYADTNNDVGFLNQDGSWRLRVVGGDYALADGSSMRAQIFYDSNDTNYYVDPAGTSYLNYSIFNGLSSADYTRQFAPSGGYFYAGGAQTGAIKIRMPANSKALYPMLSFTCHIYNYSTGTSRTFKIGGHFSNSSWYNPFAYCLSESAGNLNVRWGYEGNYLVVWIGETSSGWSYPCVFITDFQNGYSAINNSWMTGWNVSLVTAFDTVTNGPTAAGFFWNQNNDGSGSGLDADLVDGLDVHTGRNDNANKIVRTDSNGYIQAGWINTTSGDNGTNALDRIYASSDAYIRYYTPANFRTVLDVPTRGGSGASGSWGISVTGTSSNITAYTINQSVGTSNSPTFSELTLSGTGIGAYNILKYGGLRTSGDWQTFTNTAGQINVIEVHNIAGGGYTNYPTGVYTYGGVMSWRLSNHSFQLYAAHTGDLAYKTQWGNDNYSGWRRILDSSTYPYAANMNQNVRTTDNVTFGNVSAPIFYDSNNTAYYIDSASGSKLKYLQIDGDWGSSPFGSGHESFTIRSTYASMCQRQTNGSLGYWLHHVASDAVYYLYGGRGATDGSSWDWSYRAYPNQDGSYVEFRTSARAPIFYDSNNTSYYVDPASTSNLLGLTVTNTITGSVSGSSGSCTGNAANVTGTVAIANGGTGATTAANAATNLGLGTGNTPKFLNVFGERIALNSSSPQTINTQYNITELTLTSSISTLTFSNIQAAGIVHMWTLVTVGNATAYTITWPAAVKWPGGTAPTVTTANTKRDIYQFVTYDGGTTIYAIIVGQNL